MDNKLLEEAKKTIDYNRKVAAVGVTQANSNLQFFMFGATWREEQDGWISVEDATPENSRQVLTCMADTLDQYISFYKKGRNVFEVWGLGRTQPIIDMKVTHWMNLPKNPKI